MKKLLKISIIMVSVLTLFQSCVSLNSVSLTSIPAQKSNPVKVEKSKLILLGFNFDNDFINDTVVDLKSQCPNGKISGVLTKDENVNYFFYFIWQKRITVSGYCLKNANTKNTNSKTNRSTSSISEETEVNELN